MSTVLVSPPTIQLVNLIENKHACIIPILLISIIIIYACSILLLLIIFHDTGSPNATVLVSDSKDCIEVTVQHQFVEDLKQLNARYNLVIGCSNDGSTAELDPSPVTDASITEFVCSNNITTDGSTTVGEKVGGCPDYKVSVNVYIGR